METDKIIHNCSSKTHVVLSVEIEIITKTHFKTLNVECVFFPLNFLMREGVLINRF